MKQTIAIFLILVSAFNCEMREKSVQETEAIIDRPNIIIVLADDLGYGDLGCQGHPWIKTPNIDRLAREGQRWTSFYAASCVCNPSRAALLTGRLPIRIHGGTTTWADVAAEEETIAELLKSQGYATACIGKWHLGMAAGHHPVDRGFDYFYGLAGSNDAPIAEGIGFERTYDNIKTAPFSAFDIHLYRQREVIEDTVRQDLLTQRYTREAQEWIADHNDQPFLLYLAYNMPHVPIYASANFRNRSRGGLYGDVVEEIDWSVGDIIKWLEQHGLDTNTLVIFTSDNGPWLTYYDLGGSAGPLRDGKITAWEGGFRVPAIFWWPGKIQPGVVHDIGSNVDIAATLSALLNIDLSEDRIYDSEDLSPVLLKRMAGPRKTFFYYGRFPDDIWAARVGAYKLQFRGRNSIGSEEVGWRGYSEVMEFNPPKLYNLQTDISERFDIADRNPEIISAIRNVIHEHRLSMAKN